jgi:hypothetical protein
MSEECDCAAPAAVANACDPEKVDRMSRPSVRAMWAWPLALLAGLGLIVAVRVWSGWAGRPVVSMGAQDVGVMAGDSADLADAGRRLRLLSEEADALRGRLAAAEADIAEHRARAEALGDMLSADRLTLCPPFLQAETTVRALQKIIIEAASPAPASGGDERLSTAAVVARQRLRRKLEALRDEASQAMADAQTHADALRSALHVKASELQRARQNAAVQLQSRRAPEGPPRA